MKTTIATLCIHCFKYCKSPSIKFWDSSIIAHFFFYIKFQVGLKDMNDHWWEFSLRINACREPPSSTKDKVNTKGYMNRVKFIVNNL